LLPFSLLVLLLLVGRRVLLTVSHRADA